MCDIPYQTKTQNILKGPQLALGQQCIPYADLKAIKYLGTTLNP